MTKSRRRFERPLGERRYRKLFLIAAEGTVTEHEYFGIFNDSHSSVHVRCIRGGTDTAPLHVLKRLRRALASESLRQGDEAWLVVDKDAWTDEQLSTLWKWTQEGANRGLAVSNPNFEYWLLLHFEDGTEVSDRGDVERRLKRYLPHYGKRLRVDHFSVSALEAIARAKRRNSPPCRDWPRTAGQSTVYQLVERILGLEAE